MGEATQQKVLYSVTGYLDAWLQAVTSTPDEIGSRLPVADPSGNLAFAMATGGLFAMTSGIGRDVPRWEA